MARQVETLAPEQTAEVFKRTPSEPNAEVVGILKDNIGKAIRLPQMSDSAWEVERREFSRAATSLGLVLAWKKVGTRYATRVRRESDVKRRSPEALAKLRAAAKVRADKNAAAKAQAAAKITPVTANANQRKSA
jgi:hypothetical protein